MTQRYFCSQPVRGSEATLSGPEAHHLAHVMRGKPGERVVLFDGSGAEFAAEVRTIGRRQVRLAVLGRREVDRELPVGIVLGVAMPKGDRQRWLVEKAVELGVCRLVPLLSARAVARPTAGALQRWRRAVVEASKQCGRNRLMEIAEPVSWQEFVGQGGDAVRRLLAHPSDAWPVASWAAAEGPSGNADTEKNFFPCRRVDSLLAELQTVVQETAEPSASKPPATLVLAVGPEGGFSQEEVQLACERGFELLDLGPRILRVETAAVALAAAVSLACTSRQAR